MRYATIGSVSHGTLRTEDLLDTFAYELEYQIQRNAKHWLGNTAERDRLTNLIGEAREIDPDSEAASELVNESLFDALNEFAPPYTYFGAHEGDGSDFGFWPSWDAVNELPCIADPNELPHAEGDCRYVNDHGNVTVFDSSGAAIWDCV